MLPQVIFGDAAAEAAYLDASNYEFDGLEFLNGVAEDDEWSFQFNVQRDTRSVSISAF
jgi:hypothetical protein